jgi:hypothetical protein
MEASEITVSASRDETFDDFLRKWLFRFAEV